MSTDTLKAADETERHFNSLYDREEDDEETYDPIKYASDYKNVKTSKNIWNLRLVRALPLKAVRRHVRYAPLPHTSFTSIDCELCAKRTYRTIFRGSLPKSTEPGTLHVDAKGKVVHHPSKFIDLYCLKSTSIHV